MTKLTNDQIAKLEAKGFNRWTKGNMDRLYINVTELGLEVSYYNSGNVRSAKWCGEPISNADGRRFLASKVFVDVETGELHVQDRTTTDWHYFDQPTIEDKARELVDEALASDVTDDTEEVRAQIIEHIKAAAMPSIEKMGDEGKREKAMASLDALIGKVQAASREVIQAGRGMLDIPGKTAALMVARDW
jgi:hypothetical protein